MGDVRFPVGDEPGNVAPGLARPDAAAEHPDGIQRILAPVQLRVVEEIDEVLFLRARQVLRMPHGKDGGLMAVAFQQGLQGEQIGAVPAPAVVEIAA